MGIDRSLQKEDTLVQKSNMSKIVIWTMNHQVSRRILTVKKPSQRRMAGRNEAQMSALLEEDVTRSHVMPH